MGAENVARIRELNDALRNGTPHSGEWFITAGIVDLGTSFMAAAVDAVRTFTRFTKDDDPYEEHDFGAMEIDGKRVFWKIDYYDRTLTAGSPDPADAQLTKRVLTIMLASEY